ncbi:MAG: endonuclease MutS2 [Frisingicoccus sp.]|uniref:endonuclease MutS2 n=1 Tax=Frisingicoccus sp. TaxID=1918627 RepID=UPI002A81B0C3|nr:endonuclease MutS2 [Frisingicoccus sp.]MDY4834826.1 endonuclease MutS2 [Frisingicoccus sp.]
MNEKALRILEYPKIIGKLADCATSAMGKDLCEKLLPSTDLGEICQGQMETTDALSRLYAKGSISFSGLRDIRGSLLRLKVGSSLSIQELMHIASLLETALRVKSYGRRDNDDLSSDSLDGFFNAIEPLSPVCREIRRCILSEEEIADDASAGLKHVRRSIKLTNDRIHNQLNSMVNSSSMGAMLQDNLITMRGGRYCLPVKAEYRSQVQGMIHDQSSSGSTLFIEPMAVVKLNNDLRELAAKEKEEIEKILAELSNQCGEYIEELSTNVTVMTHLDFVFAKASLSRSYSGSEPIFNEKGYINIKKGRHPLLDKKKVVPIDISIGKDYRLLLVTGPNTGGKTVSLKTVGLLTLMGQAGLHIPAFDHSELSVYEEVFADIGDEQSIEQSLSTFSSHMTNIVSIIEKSNYRSLVLLDELCAGTDPTEGAALAMAILKNFLRREVTTMATTHYSELKVFALSTEGACNASCEFNVETLSPTYRLLIGIPGKSNAFAISSKLGLPNFMIEDAKKFIDANDQSFEDLISDLESSRTIIEKERLEIEAYKAEVSKLKEKLEAKQDNLAKQKERILRDANEQARKILQDAKDYADQTIRDMNKLAAGKMDNMKEMEKKRSAVRDKLSKTDERLALKKEQAQKNRPEDFHPGDSVRVLSMNLKGTITGKPNSKGQVAVQMGILKSMVNLSDLELLDEEVIKAPTLKKTGAGKIKMSKSASISTSLNIIGKTVDEAMPEVDKYLDDAYLAHLTQVTIIHGRGTGKLRTAVHNKLKKCRYVKSYRLGTFGEGETGVTIVDFK